MTPFRTPFFLPLFYPSLIWRVATADKTLYLTFDDGPVYGPTEFVLEELKRVSAKATFFCIGDNIRKHPEIFKRVVSEGHKVANHTFNHLNGWKTDHDTFINNTKLCDTEMKKHTSLHSNLFRPPYGKITKKQMRSMSNYKIIMWDVLTRDFDQKLDPEKCLKGSINATRNGSIIIFHDSIKASRNLEYVLPRYLNHFAEKGYSFSSLQ